MFLIPRGNKREKMNFPTEKVKAWCAREKAGKQKEIFATGKMLPMKTCDSWSC